MSRCCRLCRRGSARLLVLLASASPSVHLVACPARRLRTSNHGGGKQSRRALLSVGCCLSTVVVGLKRAVFQHCSSWSHAALLSMQVAVLLPALAAAVLVRPPASQAHTAWRFWQQQPAAHVKVQHTPNLLPAASHHEQ